MDNADILVENPEGKEHLDDLRCRWEVSIKTDQKGVGCEDFGFFYVVEYRVKWWIFERGDEPSVSLSTVTVG
jgi:hypothetical protein